MTREVLTGPHRSNGGPSGQPAESVSALSRLDDDLKPEVVDRRINNSGQREGSDMPITKLAHYSIRTSDLERSCEFYERLLGFHRGYRPDFAFPGAWLYRGGDESEFGIVHIIGIDPTNPEGLHEYLGAKTETHGSGAVDHIAFLATGIKDLREKLATENIAWRERTVPSLGLHQIFFEDPSGITIEMNFPADEVDGEVATSDLVADA